MRAEAFRATLPCMENRATAIRTLLLANVVFLALASSSPVRAADTARLFPYQGRLEANGNPVVTQVVLGFALHAAESGADTPLWTETHTVTPAGGFFSVVLGSVTPIGPAVVETPALYVAVTVGGTPLTGRQRIYAAPAAVKSDSGSVGIGSIIGHSLVANATSVAEMQRRGFALCDGTTPSSQGIDNAVLTATTPNLNANGLFLRGGTTSGVMQSQATAVNGLGVGLTDPGHDHVTMTTDNCGSFNGTWSVDGVTFRNVGLNGAKRTHGWDTNQTCNSGHYTTGARATGMTAALSSSQTETRPANMSVVWMIRVR